jgi:anti-sigma regulatory factor (Ser/Thr protein kinase)
MPPAAEARERVREESFPTATLADVPAVLALAEAAALEAGAGSEGVFELKLALEEAFTNVVRHGYGGGPGPVSVRIVSDGRAIVVRLEDRAVPFDPTALPEPDLDVPLEERLPGGLGVHLMRRSVDEVQHRATDGGNILTLMKRLPGSH